MWERLLGGQHHSKRMMETVEVNGHNYPPEARRHPSNPGFSHDTTCQSDALADRNQGIKLAKIPWPRTLCVLDGVKIATPSGSLLFKGDADQVGHCWGLLTLSRRTARFGKVWNSHQHQGKHPISFLKTHRYPSNLFKIALRNEVLDIRASNQEPLPTFEVDGTNFGLNHPTIQYSTNQDVQIFGWLRDLGEEVHFFCGEDPRSKRDQGRAVRAQKIDFVGR